MERERSLRENEKRTNFALAAAGMGVWEIEFATNRLIWSDTMAPVFGLAPDQAPKTTDEYFQLIHPDDRRDMEASVARAIAGERDYALEFRTIWPDGSTHWVQGRAQVSYEADGTPSRLLGIGIDITARKLLEARLEEAQKMEAIGHQMQLKAVLLEAQQPAHRECQSPQERVSRQHVARAADAAQRDHRVRGADAPGQGRPGVRPSTRSISGDILTSSKHLLQLINDVLDLAKVESGKMEFRPEPVDLAQAGARSPRHRCAGSRRASGCRWRRTWIPTVATVVVDPGPRQADSLQLPVECHQVHAGRAGAIAIRIAPEGPDLFRIDVEDTGVGIAADDLGQALRRVPTARRERREDGTRAPGSVWR